MPSDNDRTALLNAFRRKLQRPIATWQRDFGPPDDPATIGAILRPADALLQEHGVPTPASICIVRLEGSEALAVPVRLDETAVAGEILIPPAASPFGARLTGAMVLEMWSPLRFPLEALVGFRCLACCPAVAELPEMPMLAPPVEKRATYAAWQRLIRALPRAD